MCLRIRLSDVPLTSKGLQEISVWPKTFCSKVAGYKQSLYHELQGNRVLKERLEIVTLDEINFFLTLKVPQKGGDGF